MMIEIQNGTNYDQNVEYDQNRFKLVEIRTGFCLADNIEGIENTEKLYARFQRICDSLDIITTEMKHSYNKEILAELISAAIIRTGHLTYQSTIVRNLKTGLEKYASWCRENRRYDGRNVAALEYIENGKNHHIPFI